MLHMPSRTLPKKTKKRVKFMLPVHSDFTESAGWYYTQFISATTTIKNHYNPGRFHWHTVPPQRRNTSWSRPKNRTELLQRSRSANSTGNIELHHRLKSCRSRSQIPRTEILHLNKTSTNPLKYKWTTSAARNSLNKISPKPYFGSEIIKNKFSLKQSNTVKISEGNTVHMPATLSQCISPLSTRLYNYIVPQKRSIVLPQFQSRNRSPQVS